MATLERKRAYVAEQQRQLAVMLKDAEMTSAKRARLKETAPAPPQVRVADASASPPWRKAAADTKAWTHWTCKCTAGREIHPVSHLVCHRCAANQLDVEKEAIAKDKANLRPKAKVQAANPTYKYQTPPGPPPAEPAPLPDSGMDITS